MNLVLVESPTKAKTLSRFLGQEYEVRATYGHVRDLPEKKFGLTIKREDGEVVDFEPEYVVTDKQKERLAEMEKLVGKAEKVYLATDPDREGEAIAFHVREVLKADVPAVRKMRFERIAFHEITRQAINEALGRPREVDLKLVDAQQARRILDRLVGYKLSPLLWRKVRKGLSAGRVQSVAVRLVVEREKEITGFNPEEYWIVGVDLQTERGATATFQVTEKNGEKFKITDGEVAAGVEKDLSGADYGVKQVVQKEIVKLPPAPFTTSTLQQAAANKLGWSAKKTMQVAQLLYEEGNITYHRTDSTNLAAEAVKAAAEYVSGFFGQEYALAVPREYKTKSKVAQEAHEAIRPTDVAKISPTDGLNRDQERLYELIRKRFIACQMAEARGVSVKVSVSGKYAENIYGLEAKGETINFDGWLKLYGASYQNGENGEEQNSGNLPVLTEGERLTLAGINKEQKFTQPPARYNDAGLIKALEERAIGRPSTYAPILSTIQDRQYVERVEKRFKPTALGTAVNDFLVTNFPKIVDYGFTAGMEEELDEIASGDREWRPVIADFYRPFEKELETVGQTAERVKVEVETTGEKCPKCGSGDVVVRIGRFGKFLACSRYPECDFKGNYQEKIGVKCPKCGGDVIIRRTKTRKNFFGCSNYPNCDFASWTKPKPETTEAAATNQTGGSKIEA
jgi:DNA topoisomerase-1